MFLGSFSQLELGFKFAAGWSVSLCMGFCVYSFWFMPGERNKNKQLFNKFVN